MTNAELLQVWREKSAELKELYKEICRRGLTLEAAGIDVNRQCQRKWEITTPTATLKLQKPVVKHTAAELAEYD